MVLSDGTRVYLTANSYLRYPAKFGSESRDVTLVGRGYFEVEKSDVPFRVKTSDMEVEVLGTSFDVESRYSGSSSSVILVEGSVKILSEGKEQMLNPDEQASLNRKTKAMEVKRVDSKLLTMWKDGVLIVHGQSFNDLIGSLSSWYGVNILDSTSVPEDERFNGRFDREDIEAAIKAVCISAKIEYRIEGGNLILEDL
jgi:ferric-dicitrate binding protein FerR (iron transport regulator)